jgi:hypothetical protein
MSPRKQETKSQINNTFPNTIAKRAKPWYSGSEEVRKREKQKKSRKETQEKQQIRQGGPADTASRRGGIKEGREVLPNP